jgi:hypothetical protein
MSYYSHQDIMDALGYAQKKYWQYTNSDVASTKNIEKEINDMDERRLMNGMKKGMAVVVVEHPNLRGWRGTIEAFDYVHGRVGVRSTNEDKPHFLRWFAPEELNTDIHQGRRLDGYQAYFGVFMPKAKKVIYNEAAGVTVVLWEDGTKTIVRAAEGEEHDAYLGYCIALAKNMHGTNSALKRDLEKVLVVKEDKKLDTPLPTMKELADKVAEVMQKFHDGTTKGE